MQASVSSQAISGVVVFLSTADNGANDPSLTQVCVSQAVQ